MRPEFLQTGFFYKKAWGEIYWITQDMLTYNFADQ